MSPPGSGVDEDEIFLFGCNKKLFCDIRLNDPIALGRGSDPGKGTLTWFRDLETGSAISGELNFTYCEILGRNVDTLNANALRVEGNFTDVMETMDISLGWAARFYSGIRSYVRCSDRLLKLHISCLALGEVGITARAAKSMECLALIPASWFCGCRRRVVSESHFEHRESSRPPSILIHCFSNRSQHRRYLIRFLYVTVDCVLQ